MRRFEKLGIAEDVVRTAGNYSIFQQDYTAARQNYNVETSAEMALDKQNLVEAWTQAVRIAQEDHWAAKTSE